MLGKKKHNFAKSIMVNIEEEGRMVAIGITKDVVLLNDNTSVDIGDVDTDDLYGLVDKVYSELFIEE